MENDHSHSICCAMLHLWWLFKPAPWEINQYQWGECCVTNFQDSLHYGMENVQIFLDHLATSDEAVMPRFGEIKNPARDWTRISNRSFKMNNFERLFCMNHLYRFRHSPWRGSCLFSWDIFFLLWILQYRVHYREWLWHSEGWFTCNFTY